ncbi:hypothetical protein GWR56_17940 [Mucilaginibacter sp. 14171R-50]|uniref:hypothetical protein n=1 Tax=Mucilaginibacter sp. 14171R-50 TaxID=2703789 RepID=UPI00138C231B|nr:hypothetical protein [Mucilaginibacter sp. 14171R-50]QHS57329.1 hypothetical protein GWR56_17940 [Mucilaginibacter sp. 14171R-50]
MDSTGKQRARYVIEYFSNLMTATERLALRHIRSECKLAGVENQNLVNAYYKKGWLSTDPEVLALLNQGADQFMLNCAERILKEKPDEVFLNLCPRCGKLARTPQAKQCRFCGEDWH